MKALVFLLGALALTGCDRLTGAAEQKIADAEAIGFACRVSGKAPEACMKENEAQSPSSILDGWKSADGDIKSGKLDPSMSMAASHKSEVAAAEGDKKPEDSKEDEAKPTGEKKDGAAADARKEEASKPSAKEAKATEKTVPPKH